MILGKRSLVDLQFIPVSRGLKPKNKQLTTVSSVFVLIYSSNAYLEWVIAKQHMDKTYLYGLLALGLMACETTVEVDMYRSYPAQLTANMFFTPDSAVESRIDQRIAIFWIPRPVCPRFQDANIRVLRSRGSVVASLDYQGEDSRFGNSIYRAETDRPLTGPSYTLK